MPLIIFTLRRLAACAAITEFFISTRADDIVSLQDKVAKAGLGRPARVVHGGDTRQQSVANALAQVDPTTEIVLVHDAVRPFVTPEQIERVIAEARARGAAILGIPAIDTVKEVKRASLPEDVALITATIPRERIVLAQTPQAFSLRAAARRLPQGAAGRRDGFGRSRARRAVWPRRVRGARLGAQSENHAPRGYGPRALLSRAGARARNDTFRNRLRFAPAGRGTEADDRRHRSAVRQGLGGAFRWRRAGHALCDALLGAAGLGDIGTHFPDTDPKWKGASSLLFLEHTRKLLDERQLAHQSSRCDRDLRAPEAGAAFSRDARGACEIARASQSEQINLKAKTNEGTGEIGRGEAIAAHTIATLEG